jgi:hypothetical protein
MVERVKDIVLKAARLVDNTICGVEENNTWTQMKVHNIPLEHYFWRGSLGQLKEEIRAENPGIIIPGYIRWIKSIKAISEERDKGAINHSSVVLNVKDKVVAQKLLKNGIRIAGKSHQAEVYVREGLDSQCGLCNEWGHTKNRCIKTEPVCGICAEEHSTTAHLCKVGGCASRRRAICRRHEIFKCSNCAGAHPATASRCSAARRARQAARQAKNEKTYDQETKNALETELDKMSIISFEMEENEVMQEDQEGDNDTNKTQDNTATMGSAISNSDVSEAATSPNN